ncbi:MAG: prepilin-type N-terminal cleavage/methylation domain-containing protein [Nitrospirae bacterium]|nr:prepilin-type N-terminal cleavage/methylation domain-containing protein [Nitrospirota bacterium]
MQNRHGVTLVELIVVVAIIGILALLAFPAFLSMISSENKVKAAARQLVDDLKFAQNEAAAQGSGSIVNGTLRRRKVFVVFNTTANTYQVFRYEDTNGNNVRTAAEVTNPAGWAAAKAMQNRVVFGGAYEDDSGNAATINKKAFISGGAACGNGNGAPASFVSLGTQTRASDPPCSNMPCLALNSNGFPIDGTVAGGTFYLSNGKDAFAVNINSAGLTRMCKWDKGATQWVDSR